MAILELVMSPRHRLQIEITFHIRAHNILLAHLAITIVVWGNFPTWFGHWVKFQHSWQPLQACANSSLAISHFVSGKWNLVTSHLIAKVRHYVYNVYSARHKTLSCTCKVCFLHSQFEPASDLSALSSDFPWHLQGEAFMEYLNNFVNVQEHALKTILPQEIFWFRVC